MKKYKIISPTIILLMWVITPTLGQIQTDQTVQDEVNALEEKLITDDEFRLPVDEGTAAEITRLIPLLNSPQYKERENASKVLLTIGTTAFTRLRIAYHESDELESMLRIEKIVHQSYRSHHVLSKKGFLGIQMARKMPTHSDDPRIPEGHYGIKLNVITPNTGAERAGLLKDDVIIGCNGNPLEGHQQQAFNNFSKIIRGTGPGGQIHLTILREEETLEITATLGPVPQEMYRNVTGVRDLIPIIDKRFAIWWNQFFLIEDEKQSTSD